MTNQFEAEVVTLTEWLGTSAGPGPVWTKSSTDLNINLISFSSGQGVPAHINNEVDVFVVVVRGEGLIEIDEVQHPMQAGQICLIPKGALRAVRSSSPDFAYLTCHRRREGLWPVDQ